MESGLAHNWGRFSSN